ncbi:MAG: AAA family ATPase [Bacteroidales bacterium]|nr:AAA family ATPase [Bacteroidales bacterium]
MILSFTIENFRSIKSPLTIDFTTEKRLNEDDLPYNSFEQNKNEIVKSLVLYGRNASGKSNILLAFDAFIKLIKNSDKYKHEEEIPLYEPFLFDSNYKKKPVFFKIDFINNEDRIKYNYSISYISSKIISESLYFYPENTKAKLFDRNKNKITYGDYYKGSKKKIENDLLPNQLFLSKSSMSKIEYLNEVYSYLTKSFMVSTIFDPIDDITLIKRISMILFKDTISKLNLLEIIKVADTSIFDFNISENEMLEGRNIFMSHSLFNNDIEIGKTDIEFKEESLGTKKLFIIGTLILAALNEGGILLIDELDKGLHPLLTKMLIKLFNSQNNNPKNAQLLFTTHDSTLLDTEIFRRDQICFVDKDYQGCSTFYKLSDIKGVRKDIPIDKWYLSGRFKAIPVLSEPQLKF